MARSFFYRSLAAQLQGGRKAEVALQLPNSTDALLLSGKKEPLDEGRRGCDSSAAEARLRRSARQRIDEYPLICSSTGSLQIERDPNAPCRGIRASPCRGEMLISEGKRPKARISKRPLSMTPRPEAVRTCPYCEQRPDGFAVCPVQARRRTGPPEASIKRCGTKYTAPDRRLGAAQKVFFAAGFFGKERGTQPDTCPASRPMGGVPLSMPDDRNHKKRGSRKTSDIPTAGTDEPRDADKKEPAASGCGLPMLTREGKKRSIFTQPLFPFRCFRINIYSSGKCTNTQHHNNSAHNYASFPFFFLFNRYTPIAMQQIIVTRLTAYIIQPLPISPKKEDMIHAVATYFAMSKNHLPISSTAFISQI